MHQRMKRQYLVTSDIINGQTNTETSTTQLVCFSNVKMLSPVKVLTYGAIGVKYRPVTQPRVTLVTHLCPLTGRAVEEPNIRQEVGVVGVRAKPSTTQRLNNFREFSVR